MLSLLCSAEIVWRKAFPASDRRYWGLARMTRPLVRLSALLSVLLVPVPTRADDSPSELQIMVQQALLLAKPAVAIVTSRVDAEAPVDCGAGPVAVKPSPFMETGTGWFIEGRGYLVTNAHVVDPAHRLPPWVLRDMGSKAVEKACVEPWLAERGLGRDFRHGEAQPSVVLAFVVRHAIDGRLPSGVVGAVQHRPGTEVKVVEEVSLGSVHRVQARRLTQGH
jgi:hypothetical protein